MNQLIAQLEANYLSTLLALAIPPVTVALIHLIAKVEGLLTPETKNTQVKGALDLVVHMADTVVSSVANAEKAKLAQGGKVDIMAVEATALAALKQVLETESRTDLPALLGLTEEAGNAYLEHLVAAKLNLGELALVHPGQVQVSPQTPPAKQ